FSTIPIGLVRYRKLSRLNPVPANGDGAPVDDGSDSPTAKSKSDTDSDADASH
ncbi:MAG: hypothetical protein HN423_04065, partial [Alphaproteobacteria bacterium]|nr:hypothetical protein [Alphaproteobacteria bacterium]